MISDVEQLAAFPRRGIQEPILAQSNEDIVDDYVKGPRRSGMDRPCFETWLDRHRERHEPVGDLARYVAADSHWPTGAHAEQRLNYLVGRDASTELIAAMAAANVEYGDL